MITAVAWHLGVSKGVIFFYALMWLIAKTQGVLLIITGVLRSLRNGRPGEECSSVGKEASFPVLRFEELQRRERVDETCSICLMEFVGEDEVSELGRCSHVFHKDCIEKWVEKSRFTCPLCRASFFFDAETWQAKWGLAFPDSSSSLYYFLQ